MSETKEQYKKRMQEYYDSIMGVFGEDIKKTGEDKFKKAFEGSTRVKVKSTKKVKK